MDKKDIDKEPFSFSTSDICRRQLSRMSIVNEYISSKYVTNIKTKLAVTLVNRLADLGEARAFFCIRRKLHLFFPKAASSDSSPA